eukprot:7254409-Karenia_brevis.AAC.1
MHNDGQLVKKKGAEGSSVSDSVVESIQELTKLGMEMKAALKEQQRIDVETRRRVDEQAQLITNLQADRLKQRGVKAGKQMGASRLQHLHNLTEQWGSAHHVNLEEMDGETEEEEEDEDG